MKFKKDMLFSPQGRAFFLLITAFGSGILCSSIVTDVTNEDGVVNLLLVFKSHLFWITIFFFILLLFYYIPLYKIDLANNEALKDYEDKDLLNQYYEGQHKDLVRLAKKQLKMGNLDKVETLNNYANGVFGKNDKPNDDDQSSKGEGSGTG